MHKSTRCPSRTGLACCELACCFFDSTAGLGQRRLVTGAYSILVARGIPNLPCVVGEF